MKHLKLMVFCFALTACGLKRVEHKSVNVHPELKSYAAQFEKVGSTKITNLNMTFADNISNGQPGFTTLGYCQSGTKEVIKGLEKHIYIIRNVVINRAIWNGLSTNDREQLVFHELGHCVLNRPHASNYMTSIMYPYHNAVSGRYMSNYASYMQELFNKNLVAVTSFNAGAYASMMADEVVDDSTEEFTEQEMVIPHASELHEGCTHDLGTIRINENEGGKEEHVETESEVQE